MAEVVAEAGGFEFVVFATLAEGEDAGVGAGEGRAGGRGGCTERREGCAGRREGCAGGVGVLVRTDAGIVRFGLGGV